VASQPERARRLAALFAAAREPRFAALPHASPRAAALADAAADFVHDVLMARVLAALRGAAALPAWAAPPAGGTASGSSGADDGYALPQFSASPAEHVTAVGEYLLTLPQLVRTMQCVAFVLLVVRKAAYGRSLTKASSLALQLEAVEAAPTPRGGRIGGGFGDDDDGSTTYDHANDAGGDEHAAGFASAWVLRVAAAAAEAFVAAVVPIRVLTSAGARQLDADADYLCNVLAALSLPPPAPLATLRQLAASAAGAGAGRTAAAVAAAAARGAAAGGSGGDFEWDAAAAQQVARMAAAGDAADAGLPAPQA